MDLHRPSGIVAAPPIAGLPAKPPFSPHPRAAPERPRPAALPAALAFLTVHGVSPAVLLTAAAEARRQAIAPEAAVLASGTIRERFFYQCLAHHLGAVFIDGEIALGAGARYPHAIHAGLAPLDGGDGSRWLAAPRGQLLAHLLARARGGERLGARLAITTPSHLSSLVRAAATASILREASLGLANLDPSLSAKERPSHAQCTSAMAAAAAATLAFGLAPAATLAVVSLSMTCLFLASIWLRLFAGAASTACGHEPFRARVEDRRLPVYSVVVALHREARVVPQLAAALAAIDYPRGKLDIKLVIEHDDRATRRAIEAFGSARHLRDRRRARGLAKDQTPRAQHRLAAGARRTPCHIRCRGRPCSGPIARGGGTFFACPARACLPAGAARDRQTRIIPG